MSTNKAKDPSSPQLPQAVREWGVPAMKGLFLLLVASGIAGTVRSCGSSGEEATTAAASNPRESWSVTCIFASGREKRYCKLPRGGCSAPITLDPAEGKSNEGKVLWYGPDGEGVVLHSWTDIYGGTNYQLCATGGKTEAYYKLVERPS